jgi:hypothetical protein
MIVSATALAAALALVVTESPAFWVLALSSMPAFIYNAYLFRLQHR